MNAEIAYLFRHALVRDAAYQLQLPGARARLHALALDILEAVVNVDALPSVSAELADHARAACVGESISLAERKKIRGREIALRKAAANFEASQIRYKEALGHADRMVELAEPGSLDYVEGALIKAQQLWRMSQQPEAIRLATVSLEIATSANNWKLKGSALNLLASSALFQGRLDDARQAYEEALKCFRQSGEELQVAMAIVNLGVLHKEARRTEEALKCIDQAAALYLKLGKQHRSVEMRLLRANVLEEVGRKDEALAAYEAALPVVEKYGAADEFARQLANYAQALKTCGRLDEAEAQFQRAIAIMKQHELAFDLAFAREQYAGMLDAAGREEEADRESMDSIALHERIASWRFGGLALGNLASRWVFAGKLGLADAAWERACAWFAKCGELELPALCTGAVFVQACLLRGEIALAQKAAAQAEQSAAITATEFDRAKHVRPWSLLASAAMPFNRVPTDADLAGLRMQLQEIERLLGPPALLADQDAATVLKAVRNAVNEIESAAARKRPAALWYGLVPHLLKPRQRAAALDIARTQRPTELEELANVNAALLEAMREGLAAVETPPWRSTDWPQ